MDLLTLCLVEMGLLESEWFGPKGLILIMGDWTACLYLGPHLNLTIITNNIMNIVFVFYKDPLDKYSDKY